MISPVRLAQVAGLSCAVALSATSAVAQQTRIENTVAIFSALDKVTARISEIEIPLNETHQFGSLKITPRVCYSRPATERPKTTSFVIVNEVQLDGKEEKIFSGWMFAESPALNAVEHPVFDVWLSNCKGGAQPKVTRRRADPIEAEPERTQRRQLRLRRRRRIRR